MWQGPPEQRPVRFHLASTLATHIASVSLRPYLAAIAILMQVKGMNRSEVLLLFEDLL